ncbi:MAG TPA: rod shape-determining protein [Clostridiales bacterium UBA8153]|nr:rod shape-determining protein [Clostridiales bacterium UBA8153]
MALVQDIGVDLGTSNILIFVRGRGIVLREPSVVAIEQDTYKILAIGEPAHRMLGRTPGNVLPVRPLREGVIADYEVARAMLKHFLGRVCGQRSLLRPRVMICLPSGATPVEKRALLQASGEAGARATYFIEEPLAAALGAGLDVSQPCGQMVVDIGGGTTGIAILSLGGVVVSESVRIAGDALDDSLVKYVRREYGLMVGERSAEEAKIQIGTVSPEGRNLTTEIRGRDRVTGLPRTLVLTSEDTRIAMSEAMGAIVARVRAVLEKASPELSGDIMERGMVLTGGGSLLHGVPDLLRSETGVPVHLADDPITCVALGTGYALEHFDSYSKNFTPQRLS